MQLMMTARHCKLWWRSCEIAKPNWWTNFSNWDDADMKLQAWILIGCCKPGWWPDSLNQDEDNMKSYLEWRPEFATKCDEIILQIREMTDITNWDDILQSRMTWHCILMTWYCKSEWPHIANRYWPDIWKSVWWHNICQSGRWPHIANRDDDLILQIEMLTSFCKSRWWPHIIHRDDNLIFQIGMMTSYCKSR